MTLACEVEGKKIRTIEGIAKDFPKTHSKGELDNRAIIVNNGAVIDNVPPENLHAMIDATKEYGVYK